MDSKLRADWPALMHYDPQHLACIAMPLGGIGAGTVSLGGRGQLRDWEIMNRPAKGYDGGEAVFVLYAKAARQPAVTRALEGVLQPPYEGAHGARAAYHGLPRFRKCAFHAAYPLAQVTLSDPDVPVDVRLEAFNPLVPADADASGWPVAILRYVLVNKTGRAVSAAICGVLRNFIGADGSEGAPAANRNTFRAGERLRGLYMTSDGVDAASAQWGTMALATPSPATTHLCAWPSEGWRDALLHFWDDFSQDGRLDPAEHPMGDAPKGSLAAEITLAPHAEGEITFILAWHFPNRQTWTPLKGSEGCSCGRGGCGSPNTVGNYYATRFADAWDAAERCAAHLEALEAKTVRFVRALCEADLPNPVKEAALFNLSTLRSQTSLRTADGRFYGWEGCNDQAGCCHGSCTHVWNYEQATAFLFGDLSRSMREVEFLHATDERGRMSFRVNLPLSQARSYGLAAADGQMGCILKAYRDWQLCGDGAWLRALWPQVRRAIEFCWIPGGWEADQAGVMEGCQHNTLDVEYFGPNPLMAGWYLGALRAAEEMARHLGEGAFADRCRDLFARGRDWVDAHLFNGEYYEQHVLPPDDASKIAEGLRSTMGARNLSDPDYQIGPGCLVDQLAGQFMAHVCGLGHLLDPDHVRATLGSILKYNYQPDLYAHFNPMRTYALNDERALLMCTYPRGGRPRTPVPYCNEVMTGFEYTAAVGMLYEGQVAEGLRCIASIRARYDGLRRNPFDEAECGHHYARAMASWAAVLALSGFRYSAVDQAITFADAPGLHFWANGYAWGTCEIEKRAEGADVALTVLHGALTLRRLTLVGFGQATLAAPRTLGEGESAVWRVEKQ